MAHARISRVRLKSGGAEVRVLAQPDPDTNARGLILNHAKRVADMSEPGSELVGFVVLGLFSDGRTSLGYRYNPDEPALIPRALLPSYVAEIMRRDILTAAEAEDIACHVVNRANGYE